MMVAGAPEAPMRAQASPADKITLCGVWPLTGVVAEGGTDTWAGAQVAIDMIKEAGGVGGLYGGAQVELIRADAPTPDAAANETERLISQQGCKFILGTYGSSWELAGSAVAERKKVIWWGTGGATGKLTERGFKYYFRIVDSTPTYGITNSTFVVDFVAQQLRKAPKDLSVFLIYEDSDFGTSAAKATAAELRKAGVKVLGIEGHPATTTDLSSTVLKIKGAKPDVLLPCTYAAPWTLFWRQAKELDLYTPVVAGCANTIIDPNFIKATGRDAEGIFGNDAPWRSDKLKPELLKLREEYGKRLTKYTGRPITGPSIRGFVATHILLTEVLPKTGSLDAEKIIDVAMKLDIPVGGTIGGWGVKFDATHQNIRAQNSMYQIQDGQVVIVWPSEYATAEPILVPLPPWDKR
jgi:branched-chain amino acid transport system substrate-binding protein